MAPTKKQPFHAGDTYTPNARMFHWVTVGFVTVLVIIGVIMTGRAERNIWDGVTNGLYSTHKLLGFMLFWIMLWRLTSRFRTGVPSPVATLTPIQRIGSEAVHWALYGLLFVVPLLGWLGVSMYPALNIFGLFSLPSLTGKSDAAETVLWIHKALAWALVGLAGLHIAAALFHYFVLKDGVLARMMPSVRRKS
ncbi:MAG: cytochrome b [Hyphomicrobiaceae bacterium]